MGVSKVGYQVIGEKENMPIDGATIEIRQGTTLIDTLTTDANGKAQKDLPAGTYSIRIIKTGYVTTDYEIVVTEDQTCSFDLQSPPSPATASMAIEPPITDSAQAYNSTLANDATISDSCEAKVSQYPASDATLTDSAAAAVNTTTWHCEIMLSFSPIAGGSGSVSPSLSFNVNANQSAAITAIESQFWAFDGWGGDIGTQSANPYTIPAKTAGKRITVIAKFAYGWELTTTGTTLNETDQIKDGAASKTYTRASSTNWDGWYLDGVKVSTNSTYDVAAQIAGTSHTLAAVNN